MTWTHKLTASIATLIIIFFIVNCTPVNAYEDTDATTYSWGTIYTNDGFEKTFTIYKESDNYGVTEYGDEITYTIEFQCTKKKIEVLLYSDPIGIYPSSNFNQRGSGLMRVDGGKIQKISYVTLKDSSGIAFWTPKTISRAFLQGSKDVLFKIPSSVQNDAVARFIVGDFNDYASKFKSLGCSLR